MTDNDDFSLTNLNRQILATHQSVGKNKVEVAKERILSINPHAEVKTYCQFYLPNEESPISFEEYDYIVDAIDTVTGKITLVVNADKSGTPIISSMGAGNKLDPTAFEVADISKTSVCPLAKVMRRELKSYFTSPIAYIVTGQFLILNGIIFYSTFFILDRADLRQLFGNLPLLLSFFSLF